MKRIIIITGHYGSGKTNFTANLAIYLAENNNVTVADLDIVNPYFRLADFGELFKRHNIKLEKPVYANSNLDIPSISFGIEQVASEEGYLIIDVGGDEAGAVALGCYADYFSEFPDSVDMLYVINKYRFLTRTAKESLDLMREIEKASGLKHTGLINNSNLSYETNSETILSSTEFADEVSSFSGLPVIFTTIPYNIQVDVVNPFPIEVYVKKIWD